MSSNSRWLTGVVFAAVVGAVAPAQGYYPGGLVPLVCPVAGGGINSAIDGVMVDVDQDGDDDFVGRMGIPGPFGPTLSAAIGVCKSVGGTLTSGTCFPTAGQIPTALATGDLNGDGFPDLVVTCAGPPSVLLVLLNDGTGGFPSVASTPLGAGFFGVFVARVNADTIPDVILTSPGALGAGGPTLVFLGTGTGTLGPSFAGPTTVTGNVIVQDDDVDGDDDLHEVTGGVFQTYRNNLGTFSTIPRFNVAAATGLPVFADFNLDGNLDAAVIAVSPNFAFIQIAFGNGAGALAVTPTQILTPASIPTSRVFVADFDGDGDKDLVLLWPQGAYYSQNVAATFPNTKQLTWSATAAMVGDVTADGIADTVLQLPAGWSLFAGAAARGLPHLTHVAFSGGSGKGFGVADLNANGWTDVIVSRQITVSGTPTWVGASIALNVNVAGSIGGSIGPSAWEYLDFALGDFNGDSIVDVLAARANGVDLSLDSQFATGWVPMPVFAGTGIGSVAGGDVNGDGKLDAIINQSTNVTVIFGTGTGTFTGSAITPVCPNPVMTSCSGTPTIAVADLNADGFLDLVVVFPPGVNPPNFSAYLGNGTGTFSPAFTAVCGGSTWKPAIDDVNGDGIPDFVLSTTIGGLEVWFGLGGGAFAAPAAYPIVWPASPAFFGGALAVGDIDDDGFPDAALAGGAVFLNDGSGGFVQHEILPVASIQTTFGVPATLGVAVALAQVSFDLKPDLVCYAVPTNTLTVFRNVTPCSGTGYMFGLGCPGSGGFVPKLSATGCASPGGAVTLQLRDALGGAQTAALAVGPGHPLISPLIPGCSVLLQLAGAFVMPLSITGPPVAGQGRSSLPVALPPSIPPGTWVTLQAAILDPSAPLGWSATNALSLVIQ